MLKAKNLNLSRINVNILDNISIEIGQGEILTIVGPSGSGKSTIMSVLAGLIRADSGDVLFNGKSIYSEDIYQHRKRVRYIPSKPDFFTCTVEEHLYKICEYLGIENNKGKECFLSYFDTLSLNENILKKHTGDISTGERKRIFLIQNLLIPAQVYLLDEVFTGLDPEITTNGFELLKEISQAIILTSHNIDFMKKLNSKSIFVKNGKIITKEHDFFKSTKNNEVIRYLNGGNNVR